MKHKTKEIALGKDDLNWFRKNLGSKYLLHRLINAKIEQSNTSISVFLSVNVDLPENHNLDWSFGAGATSRCNSAEDMVDEIYRYLSTGPRRVALIFDPALDTKSKLAAQSKTRLLFYGKDEGYHLLISDGYGDREYVDKSMGEAYGWNMTVFLVALNEVLPVQEEPLVVDGEFMDKVARRTECVLMDAFDQDAFLMLRFLPNPNVGAET